MIVKTIFSILYATTLLLISPISIWLLFNAATWVGRGLAVVALLALPLPILIRRSGKTAVFIIIASVGFLTAVISATPSGNPDPNSPIQHRFFRDAKFSRFAISNIIPESEQINLGFLLMTYADPLLSAKQVERVASFTLNLYREMKQDRNFHQLGSVMDLAYAEPLGLPFDAGHYYLYAPQKESNAPLPAIVFLHGSGGNFKTYIWVWSKLAEAEDFVIIAPSYGFGNWDQNGVATVQQAIEDAKQQVNIDENKIYLAGLSNGGLGVSQLAAQMPQMFQGLIFISPVMSTDIVDGKLFQTNWANRPILIISGETDRRVPLSYVQQRIAQMENGNINVTLIIYPNEDHFLFYSEPEKIMADVANWLMENGQ